MSVNTSADSTKVNYTHRLFASLRIMSIILLCNNFKFLHKIFKIVQKCSNCLSKYLTE